MFVAKLNFGTASYVSTHTRPMTIKPSRTMHIIIGLLLLAFSATLSSAQDLAREIRRSPDGRYFAGWFDRDAGDPFGLVRVVVVRSATDPASLFSFVSSPRSTQAAWNAASTQCAVVDAPDNGGPKVWLVYRKDPQEWAVREVEPFATLYEEFRKSDPEVRRLFRPSISKINWITDTQVRFRGYCNTGTYLITIDTAAPKQPPALEKLSDQFLEE